MTHPLDQFTDVECQLFFPLIVQGIQRIEEHGFVKKFFGTKKDGFCIRGACASFRQFDDIEADRVLRAYVPAEIQAFATKWLGYCMNDIAFLNDHVFEGKDDALKFLRQIRDDLAKRLPWA